MSRAVFLNVSAAGHVFPSFGLVAELIHRGEEVIYYEIPKFQKEIEAFGASFRFYPPLRIEAAPQGHNDFSLVPVLTWTAKEMLSALLESVRADKPDYIIHDSLCLWGKLVAQLLNIPAVNTIASAAFCPRSFYECPQLQDKLPELLSETSPDIQVFRQYETELRETYKIPPIEFIDTFTNPEPLNICYLPPELQPYVDKFDQSFHFVGPCDPVRAIASDFPMELLQKDKLILISFGSIHDPGLAFYKNCIEAFHNIDAQVLMVLSPEINATQLGDVPTNFIIRATGTIPQLKILERTSLFIMHGAGGGAREAAWHSTPTIAIPQTYEQEIISRRLQEQGAGIMILPQDVNSERLRETALHILNNDSFQANSDRLGDACRAAGGAKRAVDEILGYVAMSGSKG
ncbi:MAG: macrolide family glycosyltransferase [Nostoc sp.]|uniref:macrolide family glycosyltransferase n=1 Tax=Nostoc sp. TaxID=1180 RepID=UPI002FF4C011